MQQPSGEKKQSKLKLKIKRNDSIDSAQSMLSCDFDDDIEKETSANIGQKPPKTILRKWTANKLIFGSSKEVLQGYKHKLKHSQMDLIKELEEVKLDNVPEDMKSKDELSNDSISEDSDSESTTE